MSSLDTARLSSHPETETMLQDPHPDLLDPATSSRTQASTRTEKETGGQTQAKGSGMHGAMSARYDPSTKLATGTTMGEYRRINMWSTTVGMWGGLLGGGLLSEFNSFHD
jgi:hypothetical protein